MARSIQSVRGMHDLLPDELSAWQSLEHIIRDTVSAYGYREIRTPIVESTDLFSRSIGEVTDIVEKEMYTFEDRNGDMLTLRPEGTAGCVRAGIQNGILHNQIQRLWYMGPMFRHERPQKGRYRQFHQLGVEVFGITDAEADAELILMSARLWRRLGLTDSIRLELNTLGSIEDRAGYKIELVKYLNAHKDRLDEDSLRRLETNPLRILDSKNPQLRDVIQNAPKMIDYLDAESAEHFSRLKNILDAAGIQYSVNPQLVRGLDYYCKTVFEWVTDRLGAQGTVCAGGRFDGLVEQLGGKSTPAAGFAIGLERLLSLVNDTAQTQATAGADVYFILLDESSSSHGIKLAETLRDELPGLKIITNCGGGSMKNQMKKADKSGAGIAIIIGENEINNQSVAVKFLREDRPQETVSQKELISFLTQFYK